MSELDTVTNPAERLAGLRAEIDAIDEQIIALWAQRNNLAAAVGAIKQETGAPVYAHNRDLEVRDRWGQRCEEVGIRRDLGREACGLLMTTSYAAQRAPLSATA